MRIRKRFVTLGLTAAAALAVGVIGFVVSASGHGGTPLIPGGCPAAGPPPGGDNKSCFDFTVTPNNPGAVADNSTLFAHTHSHYEFPGDKNNGGFAKTVTVHFDSDFTVNLAAVAGACSAAGLTNDTPAQAMAQCQGQYLGSNGPTKFSGSSHAVATQTFPAGVRLCNLVFKGANNSQVILYNRAYLDNGGPSASCTTANPQTETSTGPTRANSILIGTLAASGLAGFGKKLTVPNIDTQALPLDEFSARVKKGAFFKAKCTSSPDTWKTRVTFLYSGTGQPTDTVNKTRPCT